MFSRNKHSHQFGKTYCRKNQGAFRVQAKVALRSELDIASQEALDEQTEEMDREYSNYDYDGYYVGYVEGMDEIRDRRIGPVEYDQSYWQNSDDYEVDPPSPYDCLYVEHQW